MALVSTIHRPSGAVVNGVSRRAAVTSDDPRPPTYASKAYVECYLNPDTQPGCAFHADPDCLCDVDLSKHKPVELKAAPAAFLNVTDVDSLIEAATHAWVENDVLRDTGGRCPQWLIDMDPHTLAKLVKLARTPRLPVTEINDKLQLPEKITGEVVNMLRTLHSVQGVFASRIPTASKQFIPQDRVVELVRSGKSAREVAEQLYKEHGHLWDQKSVRRAYEKGTGEKVPKAKGTNNRKLFPRERVIELHEAGKDPATIFAILVREGHHTYPSSVREFIKRGVERGTFEPRRSGQPPKEKDAA